MANLLTHVTADTTVSNSAAKTTIFTYSVPAYSIGSVGFLRLRLFCTLLNNSGANRTYTFTTEFGGTIYVADAAIAVPTSAALRTCIIDVWVVGDGATNAQIVTMCIDISAVLAVTTGLSGDFGTAETVPPTTILNTAAIDTTAAQTLLCSITSDAATATQTFTVRAATLERVAAP